MRRACSLARALTALTALGTLGARTAHAEEPIAATAPDAQAVEVRGAPARASTGAPVVSADEGARLAGSQGDAGKSVLALPGITRGAFDSGALIVWGSAASDTRVYVDGVEVPYFFHGSALRSVLPSELVQSVSLVPGGFGPELGRGTGGALRVKTKPLDLEANHGALGLDPLDAHAVASVTSGAHAVAVGGRYGYFDRVLPLVTDRDVGDYVVIPRYRDWQAKATFSLRAREELSLVLLGARDEARRALPSGDPSAVRAETTTRGFQRAYARYRRVLDDGAEVEATPFVGSDEDLYAASFGDVPASVEARSLVYGMRASYRAPLARSITLALGLDALGTRATLGRTGSLTIPGREGDLTYFGRPPGGDVATDAWSTHVLGLAPWLEAQVDLGPLTVTPGVRVEASLIETSRLLPQRGLTPPVGSDRVDVALDPRVAARLRVSSRVSLGASLGRYHQPPTPQDLSAVFGTPALISSSALHATAVASITPLSPEAGLSIDAVGFYKRLSNLPVRTRAATPRLATALVQDGEGRAYGLELLVRKKLSRGLFGWISYTLSRSERRYVGDPSYRLFDGDQPHVLAVVASQQLGEWTLGARFRYTSGLPQTAVVAAYRDLRGDRAEPIFGAQNAARLPAFYALDLRVERAFSLSERARLVLSLDVLDATFHRNAEAIAYAPSFASHAYVTGLPTVALAGAKVEL